MNLGVGCTVTTNSPQQMFTKLAEIYCAHCHLMIALLKTISVDNSYFYESGSWSKQKRQDFHRQFWVQQKSCIQGKNCYGTQNLKIIFVHLYQYLKQHPSKFQRFLTIILGLVVNQSWARVIFIGSYGYSGNGAYTEKLLG